MDWSISVILIVAGLLFILISKAKIGGKVEIDVPPQHSKLFFSIGCGLFVLGIIFSMPYIITQMSNGEEASPISTETPTETPEIHIISPSNESTVKSSETVRGTVENLPDGSTVFLFVYPLVDGKYYPQEGDGQRAIIENGTWYDHIGVGTPDNSGDVFYIVATVADKKALDDVKNYIITAQKTNEWGMANIPASVKVSDTVTVTRV